MSCWTRCVLMLSVLGSAACAGATHEVDVGDATARSAAGLDLTVCQGEDTSCEAVSDAAPRVLQSTAPAVECALDPEHSQLEVAWSALIELSSITTAVTPEGSLWAAGSPWAQDATAQIVVERYDREGGRLWHTELILIEGHDVVNAGVTTLAFDARGHGHLAIATRVADQARGWVEFASNFLVELDERGNVVGEPLEVPGVLDLRLAVASDGGLLLSGERDEGVAVLGRLAPDRTLAWAQTNMGQLYVYQAAIDEGDRAFVLGRSSRESTVTAQLGESLATFDSDGNWLWEIEPLFEARSFALSDDGGAVLAGGSLEAGLLVVQLSDTGEIRWSRSLGQFTELDGALAIDARGDVYLPVFMNDVSRDAVFRFDRDGGDCTELHLPPSGALAQLQVAADGALFFAHHDNDEAFVIGRLAP